MIIKYFVTWTENGKRNYSDPMYDAKNVWDFMHSKSVTMCPEIVLVTEDTKVEGESDIDTITETVVGSMYTVIWTNLADFIKIRHLQEVKEAMFALERANPKAGRLGSENSLGAFDCCFEE